MIHAFHEKPRRIFGDDCAVCLDRVRRIEGLFALDPTNLRKLGALSRELADNEDKKKDDMSFADVKAVFNLRAALRLVRDSGLLDDLAYRP